MQEIRKARQYMICDFLKVKKPDKIDDCRVLLAGSRDFDPVIMELVAGIMSNIRKYGDRSLLKYCARFDGSDAKSAGELRVSDEEIREAAISVPAKFPGLVAALETAYSNLRQYHEKQLENESIEWILEKEKGKKLGQIINPIEKLGIYIPGGRYVYPSTVLMTAVPAITAGVKDITVCTPPSEDGKVNDVLLYLFSFLDISRVFKIGGAQAVAALAFGTETVEKVDMIAGPGNVYVTAAKKLVYGITGIDSLAGPSEVVVLADNAAEPSFIAADLLSQAEHDPDSRSILLSSDLAVAENVIKEISFQLEEISSLYPDRFNRDILKAALKKNCSIVFNPDMGLLIEICNLIAPEHLEIMVSDHGTVLSKINNAGAIFIGDYTPVAAGDYICGTNHVIPTGGNARFSSPLGVHDFLKRSSLAYYDKKNLGRESGHIEALADFENLLAHKNSIKIRFRK
jgi:histidinol dehydrogenase